MFKKKFFIVFEGIEGSGKSFQSKKLYDVLKKKYNTIITREPGGTKSSELIRDLILKDYFNNKKGEKFDKYTDTLIYLAARNEHVLNKIKPALKEKKIVICDRFIDSTSAYQVYGKKVDETFIKNIHKKILYNVRPDITILLKVNIKKAILRVKKRRFKNRYDKLSKSFYRSAQNAFIKIAKKSKNHYIFDSSNDDNVLENQIISLISKKLK